MDGERPPAGRLYRSRKERMIAGVCGGLAQYFNIDPVLVRLAFVALLLMGGGGLLAYIILAIVVPERHPDDVEPPITSSVGTVRGREIAAYVLIGFGLLLLASNMGWFAFANWRVFLPIYLIGLGVLLLFQNLRGRSDQ